MQHSNALRLVPTHLVELLQEIGFNGTEPDMRSKFKVDFRVWTDITSEPRQLLWDKDIDIELGGILYQQVVDWFLGKHEIYPHVVLIHEGWIAVVQATNSTPADLYKSTPHPSYYYAMDDAIEVGTRLVKEKLNKTIKSTAPKTDISITCNASDVSSIIERMKEDGWELYPITPYTTKVDGGKVKLTMWKNL